jgi:N-acetylneuraminate synthase
MFNQPKFSISDLTPQNPLLILDLANNHNGSLAHGKRIIDEITNAAQSSDFQIAIKFQYRDLPNFIHPEFRTRRDIKYVDRFLSTQMTWDEFKELKDFESRKKSNTIDFNI